MDVEANRAVARVPQKKSAALKRFWVREGSSWLLVIPTLLAFVFFSWQPLVSGVVLSFFKTQGYEAVSWAGLDNYVDIVQNSVFRHLLVNSFLYVAWSLIIGAAFPILVSVMINEIRIGKSFFKFAVFFPNMVPAIAAAMMWMFLFQPGKGGLLNMLITSIGIPEQSWLQNPNMTIPLIIITITWRNFGGTVLLYMARLSGINHELYEAASLDGAGVWRRFWNVTLPQMSGLIGLMLILQISGVFQIFNEPLVMTSGGPGNASITLMLQSYLYAFQYFEAGHALALGVITFLILMCITAIYFFFEKKWDKET